MVASLGGSKKKKRRSGRVTEREKERSASPLEIPIDPDEPTYCLCDQVSLFDKQSTIEIIFMKYSTVSNI